MTTLTLTPEQETRLQDLLERGQFESPEQFITCALASVEGEDAETTSWLKMQVEQGLKSLDAGRYSSKGTEEVVAEAERELAKHR